MLPEGGSAPQRDCNLSPKSKWLVYSLQLSRAQRMPMKASDP